MTREKVQTGGSCMKLVIKVLAVFAIILGGTAYYLNTKTEGVHAFVDNFFSNKEIQDYYAVVDKGEKKTENTCILLKGIQKTESYRLLKE